MMPPGSTVLSNPVAGGSQNMFWGPTQEFGSQETDLRHCANMSFPRVRGVGVSGCSLLEDLYPGLTVGA